eukprot:6199579-Pleurochrysis_carterae.AAC.3
MQGAPCAIAGGLIVRDGVLKVHWLHSDVDNSIDAFLQPSYNLYLWPLQLLGGFLWCCEAHQALPKAGDPCAPASNRGVRLFAQQDDGTFSFRRAQANEYFDVRRVLMNCSDSYSSSSRGLSSLRCSKLLLDNNVYDNAASNTEETSAALQFDCERVCLQHAPQPPTSCAPCSHPTYVFLLSARILYIRELSAAVYRSVHVITQARFSHLVSSRFPKSIAFAPSQNCIDLGTCKHHPSFAQKCACHLLLVKAARWYIAELLVLNDSFSAWQDGPSVALRVSLINYALAEESERELTGAGAGANDDTEATAVHSLLL